MKQVAITVFLVLASIGSFGKSKVSHGKWFYESKKLDGSEYEIIFHLNLDKDWYVSAEDDDSKGLLPPAFTFDPPNGTFTFSGTLVPKGIMESKKIRRRGFVNIYNYNAIYSQKIFARPNTKVTGSFKYQIFSEKKRQRVQTETFEIIVK